MAEMIGDLRGNQDATAEMAREQLHSLGYFVASDSNQIGLNQRFRLQVLPLYTQLLGEDVHRIPPSGRRRVDGLVDFVRTGDDTVQLTRDYQHVAIPTWSGNGSPDMRVYPDGLPIMGNPDAQQWLESVISLAVHELEEPEGTASVHYFETGHESGKVVARKHRDGELITAAFPEFINGEGAETTLYRPINTPSRMRMVKAQFEQIAAFRLGIGDIAMSHDVSLWHYVSELEQPASGAVDLRRRSFIVSIHSQRTNRWMRQIYGSGLVPADVASRAAA